ncbi:MAG: lysophospholipase [Firmicutes bacterium]|nr:lysophospholipase [Bacillota bacterium]
MATNLHTAVHDTPSPLAVMVLIHGLGEHSGRYAHVIRAFTDAHVAVVAGDLPGHGHSPGLRGHIDHFDDYIVAANHMLQLARERYPSAPCVLFGHSLGGLIAALCASRAKAESHAPAALLLSGPCFRLRKQPGPVRLAAATVLLPFMPRLYQSDGISPGQLTRDADMLEAIKSDHLLHHRVTLRWFFELRKGMARAALHASDISIPTAIFCGEQDPIVSSAASRAWLERTHAKEKQFTEYPGLLHEILNEPERAQVTKDMLAWLHRTISAPST